MCMSQCPLGWTREPFEVLTQTIENEYNFQLKSFIFSFKINTFKTTMLMLLLIHVHIHLQTRDKRAKPVKKYRNVFFARISWRRTLTSEEKNL